MDYAPSILLSSICQTQQRKMPACRTLWRACNLCVIFAENVVISYSHTVVF